MEHSTQDDERRMASATPSEPLMRVVQLIPVSENVLIEILSHLWVDQLYLSPQSRTYVQSKRLRDLERLYPGVLEGDTRAIDRLFKNPEAVEFFATLQESKRYVNRIATNAAYYGNMALLERMLIRGANSFKWIAASAAKVGHFGIVQWAVKQGANDFNRIARAAAEGGHFEIIQWTIEKGANYFDWIAEFAARGGHLKIVQWAVEEKGACSFNGIVRHATDAGYPEIAQWIQEYQRSTH